VYVIIGLVSYLPKFGGSKHMKIQGKELYVFMQCTCIDINMGELSESGKSMQFLKVIEHANEINA
jgi:hypothetical protein